MENSFENEKYDRAKKKVEEIKGFYGNLISYVAVNGFLVFLNLRTSPEYLWSLWPIMGWGVGLLIHGLKVFDVMPFFGKEWEEKKINELMQKEKENQNKWQ
ncbi:2TM domain-containing protein [Flavobacterium agrisoli]|uniref:2TM domain-containing protein n=1 Tax=Flavobacterium agrisoli TaxID=2793066 RepID=A0A934UJ37_9FLAO|nr:2TM domain-containing protein [Flavobacterium agrisoli]MBK0369194.1 2TM domain-containing protein [Flavobacterium agrisoli]